MIDRQGRMEASLETLVATKGALGAAIVSRDGLPVSSRFTPSFNEIAFSILVEGAMMATLVGAAEQALSEVEGGRMRKIVVEGDKITLFAVGVNDDVVLVAFAEAGVAPEAFAAALETVARSLAGILAGG